MKLLPPNRVITTQKAMRKLPVGAVVVNGYSDQAYYIFAKVSQDGAGDFWKLYSISKDDYSPHERMVAHKPELFLPQGARELNLPVYLLSESGEHKEMVKYLGNFLKEVKVLR